MIVYAIRNKETKQFSGGGCFPFFRKKGKIWSGIAALKNHINQAIGAEYGGNPRYIFRKAFIPYMNSELIITDTETLTSTVDGDFIPNYLRQKAIELTESRHKYPLDEETKKLLGL